MSGQGRCEDEADRETDRAQETHRRRCFAVSPGEHGDLLMLCSVLIHEHKIIVGQFLGFSVEFIWSVLESEAFSIKADLLEPMTSALEWREIDFSRSIC